jgi:hypothetical protein
LSDSFPIQNGLKQGDTLSPLIFIFAIEYAIRKVQENQVGMILNGIHHLLAYADEVYLLRDNIQTINKNTKTLNVRKEVGPEINAEKTKYMLLSHYQDAGQNWNIRREHRLRVFGNRVLRRMFEPRRDKVTRGWRKLHKEELNDLYSSPSIIKIIKSKRMGWAGHVAQMGEKENVYRLLVGKPEEKRPLGRWKPRWVDYIKMDLGEVGWGGEDWIGLAQDRDKLRVLVNVVTNIQVPNW